MCWEGGCELGRRERLTGHDREVGGGVGGVGCDWANGGLVRLRLRLKLGEVGAGRGLACRMRE